MMFPRLRCLIVFLAVLVWLGLSPLSAQSESQEHNAVDSIVIGSKLFPESRILAEMMSQMIESETDIRVDRRLGLGGTMVCFQAMRSGDLDIYPEYTGTGLVTVLGLDLAQASPLRTYLTVAREFRDQFSLVWLEPWGFNNTYALALRQDTAEKLGIETISDLREHQDSLQVGVSHEFLSRPDGFPGLQKLYDLHLSQVRGLEHSLAYQAMATKDIDVTDAFSTDGELLRYNLKLLTDDRALFPPYQGAPIVRQEILLARPEIGEVLNKLAWRIDDEKMRRLNYRVQVDKVSIAQVAREFLQEEGLLEGSSGKSAGELNSQDSMFGELQSQIATTGRLTGQHLTLVGLSLGMAVLVGVPLGVFITRHRRFSQTVLSISGVIQTIPSIALLAFFIAVPGLGLGLRSAVLALFLYALLPIVRNTYTGILGIDPRLLESARGIGLTQRQILRVVEIPLATKTIMAGVRTSAVINVGVATLAAFIGAGGLGDPIVTGLQLNDPSLILWGAIPAALLALVVDKVLGMLETKLSPNGG